MTRGQTPVFAAGGRVPDPKPQILIATILREHGTTGVHTHVREVQRYFGSCGVASVAVTPFSGRPRLASLTFSPRLLLERLNGAAGVLWYRHWHEIFLREALAQRLADMGDVVIYAQGPEAARAALHARSGPHQRVVLAVHFQGSQANGWVDKGHIRRGGPAFWAIRRMESEVIPSVDRIVYVSRSAKRHLVNWLPEAERVPSEVIYNFVEAAPNLPRQNGLGDLVTIGSLDPCKNHEFILRVLAAAKQRGRTFTLDIYGEGPSRKELTFFAASIGVSEQVRFRGIRPNVRDLLPAYRVYVHASKTETGPLAIIEAMAAGLPTVAGNIGSISEVYDEGVEGRFWPLDDPDAAAQTLIELLESDQAVDQYKEAALRRFNRQFQSDVVGPRLFSFLMGPDEMRPDEMSPDGLGLDELGPDELGPDELGPDEGLADSGGDAHPLPVGPPHPHTRGDAVVAVGARQQPSQHRVRRGAGHPQQACVVLDGQAMRRKGRGVARALKQLFPLLMAEPNGIRWVTVTTEEGVELLGPAPGEVVTVPSMPMSAWEQFGLPWYARKLGASAVYSLGECGPVWGPPLLLHVTEDPNFRWLGTPAGSTRERARRLYQGSAMRRSLAGASLVATCSQAIAHALTVRFNLELSESTVVPLGVDTGIFYPDRGAPREEAIFHLGSPELRDQSVVVVNAYAQALAVTGDLPDLVIGGELGERLPQIREAAERAGISGRLQLLGRISDDELRQRYAHAAVCAQPARYEGFGLQPLEALACGAPLVVFPEPAVEEVVSGAAVVVSDKTEAALAEAIVALWQDPGRRARLREAGPERAAQFPWSATAKALSELLLAMTQEPELSDGRAPGGFAESRR